MYNTKFKKNFWSVDYFFITGLNCIVKLLYYLQTPVLTAPRVMFTVHSTFIIGTNKDLVQKCFFIELSLCEIDDMRCCS